MAFGVRKTGFKLFLEQYLNDLQSDLDVVLSEVMCHNAKIFCSALWRDLPDELKAPYNEEANTSISSVDELDEAEEETQAQRNATWPLNLEYFSAKQFFYAQHYLKVKKDYNVHEYKDVITHLNTLYHSLTPEDQAKYEEMARKEKIATDAYIEKWGNRTA